MWKIQYRNKCNWYNWKYRNNWKYKNMKICRDRHWLRIIRLWRDKSLWRRSPRNSLSRFRKRATTRANVAAATSPWRTSISNPRRSCANARTASVKSISRRTGKHRKSDLNFLLMWFSVFLWLRLRRNSVPVCDLILFYRKLCGLVCLILSKNCMKRIFQELPCAL